MNNPDIRKEVVGLINTLKAHFDALEEQVQIPQEELVSLLDEVEMLYRKMVIFNHLGAISENKIENLVAVSLNESGTVFIEQQKEMVVPEAENVLKAPALIAENKQEGYLPVAEVHVITDLKEEVIAQPIIEKESVQRPEIKEEKIKEIPKVSLGDLKSGIGINDKFQFIAELFAGSGDKYEDTIKQLNSLETLESSLVYLEELSRQYSWKEDSEPAQRLTELVKRRFI